MSYSYQAAKVLARLPKPLANRIYEKMDQYAAAPQSLRNNVKRLQGLNDILRMRVGDWRVIFTEDGSVVSVLKVAPRGGAYE